MWPGALTSGNKSQMTAENTCITEKKKINQHSSNGANRTFYSPTTAHLWSCIKDFERSPQTVKKNKKNYSLEKQWRNFSWCENSPLPPPKKQKQKKTKNKKQKTNTTKCLPPQWAAVQAVVTLIPVQHCCRRVVWIFNRNNKGQNRKPTKLEFWSTCWQEYICEAHRGVERI